MDEEIKKLIEDYVKKIEDKEEELTSFSNAINNILAIAKKELEKVTTELNMEFDTNNLSEEDYLKTFREKKESILKESKGKMEALIAGLEEKYGK